MISMFSVVQSTARKLQEKETRKAVVANMMQASKKDAYWERFPGELQTEIEAFTAEDKDIYCFVPCLFMFSLWILHLLERIAFSYFNQTLGAQVQHTQKTNKHVYVLYPSLHSRRTPPD